MGSQEGAVAIFLCTSAAEPQVMKHFPLGNCYESIITFPVNVVVSAEACFRFYEEKNVPLLQLKLISRLVQKDVKAREQ